MIKGGKKKSKNRLTRHRVGRVTGSTDGWSVLSRFLALPGFSGSIGPVPGLVPGFSGWTDRAGLGLTTLVLDVFPLPVYLRYLKTFSHDGLSNAH